VMRLCGIFCLFVCFYFILFFLKWWWLGDVEGCGADSGSIVAMYICFFDDGEPFKAGLFLVPIPVRQTSDPCKAVEICGLDVWAAEEKYGDVLIFWEDKDT
jgi:hypothetical protein